jgi:4-amino-4-deoxy-L-arabinose transferase-like glycosyltransferase
MERFSLYQHERRALLLIVLVGFSLRVWGIGFGLPYDYHPDEHQYVSDAVHFLTERDLNPHKFNNPTLYKYVLFIEYGASYVLGRMIGIFQNCLGFEAFWANDPTLFFLMGRLTTAGLGTATILLTYIVGKRAYGRRQGLIAALFLSFASLHARDSHYAVNDVPLAFMTCMALLCCSRLMRSGSWRAYVEAGAIGGLATSVKHSGVFLVLPLLLAHIVRHVQSHRARLLARLARIADRKAIIALLAFAGAYVLGTPYSLLDHRTFISDVLKMRERGAYGYKGIQVDSVSGWVFYLKSLRWGLGYILLGLALIGVLYAVWRHQEEDLLLVSYPLLLYLFMGGQLMFFSRFMIPAIPVLMVLAARCLIVLGDWLPLGEVYKRAAVPFLAALVLAQPAWSTIRHDVLLTREDTRTLARQWIEANIPSGARIARESLGPSLSGQPPPVPRSDRVYDVSTIQGRKIVEHPIEYYKENYDYLVINSFEYDMALSDEGRTEARERFYRDLDSQMELVAVFAPYTGATKPPFVFDQIYGPLTSLGQFDRPGPVVKIYKTSTRPIVQHPQQALFGEALRLRGYSLGTTIMDAGDMLEVILYYQVLAPISQRYHSFVHLLTPHDLMIAQEDQMLGGTHSPSRVWAPGETIVDRHEVPVPADATPGEYSLSVGLYDQDDKRLVVRRVDGQRLAGDQLILGVRPVVRGPAQYEAPPVEYPVGVRLGQVAWLVGYNLSEWGDKLEVELVWEGLAPPVEPGYIVFVHLRREGALVVQHDGVPGGGRRPTVGWRKGEFISDYHVLPLDDVPEGNYSLFVGMYDPATGERVSASDASQALLSQNEVPLGSVKTKGRR